MQIMMFLFSNYGHTMNSSPNSYFFLYMAYPDVHGKDLEQFCFWIPKTKVKPTFICTKRIHKGQNVYKNHWGFKKKKKSDPYYER